MRFALVPAAIAAMLALPPGVTKDLAREDGRILVERETEYQYARVVERPDGERRLELNEGQAFHSVYRPDTVLTGNVWDGYISLPVRRARPPAALGRDPRQRRRHDRPRVRALLPGDRDRRRRDRPGADRARPRALRARGPPRAAADPRRTRGPFLRSTDRRYDAIFVDAYRQPYIPFYLTTEEFFDLVRDRLNPGGTVIVNAGHPEGSRELEKVLAAGVRSEFEHLVAFDITEISTLLIAADRPPSGSAGAGADGDRAPARCARCSPAPRAACARRSSARRPSPTTARRSSG